MGNEVEVANAGDAAEAQNSLASRCLAGTIKEQGGPILRGEVERSEEEAVVSDRFDILDLVRDRVHDTHADALVKEEYKLSDTKLQLEAKYQEEATLPTSKSAAPRTSKEKQDGNEQQHGVSSKVPSPSDLEKQSSAVDIVLKQAAMTSNERGQDSSDVFLKKALNAQDEIVSPRLAQPQVPLSNREETDDRVDTNGREDTNETQPGAYSGAPGRALDRREQISFSILRVQPEEVMQSTESDQLNEEGLSQPPNVDEASDYGPMEHRLSEALPIDDDSLPDMEAQPIDMAAEQQRKIESKKKNWQIFLLFVLLLVMVVGAIVLASFFGKQGDESPPTVAPSLAPSELPSFAPTGLLDTMMENLPISTQEALKTYSTPQWQAMDWMENHPNLMALEDWRKTQLFALATIFFAMEGTGWPEGVSNQWLLPDQSECYWLNSDDGQFNEEGVWMPFTNNQGNNSSPCNENSEFTSLYLVELKLADLNPIIPPEVSMMTSLSDLSLPRNNMSALLVDFLPPQLYTMSNLTDINLQDNALSGPIPTEFGLMYNLENLHLKFNSLSGNLPTEFGMMTSNEHLCLTSNTLTGSIPSELGQMSRLLVLELALNSLTGQLPSELLQMTNVREIDLGVNSLSGHLPSEIALMTSLITFRVDDNSLTGSIPTEFGLLDALALEILTLANNSLTGSIPENLCLLGKFEPSHALGLSFDCNDQLCGCCWCPCEGSNYSAECITQPFVPSRDDEQWPGSFPIPVNNSNSISINVRTDDWPEELSLEWKLLRESEWWEVVDIIRPFNNNSIHSYTQEIEPDSVYRLQIMDIYGDGSCCDGGFGWFTITNSTPSSDDDDGSIVWEAAGYDFGSSLDVFIWVDAEGNIREVEDIADQEQMALDLNSTIVLPLNATTGTAHEFVNETA